MATTPRFPERSSSFSAIDFPHGPPNSPSSNTASPDTMSLNTALTIVPDEEIPQFSLQDKKNLKEKKEQEQEIKMAKELHRSLSKLEIKVPSVEEFTFEPTEIEDKEEQKNMAEAHGVSENLRTTALDNGNGAPPKNTQASPIVRPATPMVPLWFGGKKKSSTVQLADSVTPLCCTLKGNTNHLLHNDDEKDTSVKVVELPCAKLTKPIVAVPATKHHNKNSDTPLCMAFTEDTAVGTHNDDKKLMATKVTELPPTELAEATATVSVAENYKENKLTSGKIIYKKYTFVVAISGCSSAGKSLLAKILSTVLSSTTTHPVTNASSESKKTITISQDDFFQPKALLPLITFTSSPADAHFMAKSIHYDEQGMYYIASSGSRSDRTPHGLLACVDGFRYAQRTDSFDSAKSDASRALEGGHRPRYQVTGPMTDCDQAIDFVGLVEAIINVKSTGQLSEYAKYSSCDQDMDGFSGLIEKMKEKVCVWLKEQAILNAESRFGGCVVRGPIENDGKKLGAADGNGKESLRPQFVFVEGFLLLAPNTSVDENKLFDVSTEKAKVEKYTTQLETLSTELVAKHNIDAEIEGERDVIEAQLWATNFAAKEHLQDLFDVKFFLNTSKEEAKRRRFERAIYIDAPTGGRLPGQMWKSEGYFEEGVWKGYQESYGWLLESETAKGGNGKELVSEQGVFVEPVQDADIEVCVEWAVDVLLAKMGQLEAEARVAGGGCCTDD